MKVEDLILLLNNRLREYKLSQNYATMSGDLERVVAADKEIIALEDTLFKLNLLVDASNSATVKEAVLADVITDGSVAVLGEYDITSYATDPLHEEKIMTILSNIGVMDTEEKIDGYINAKYISSPVTGEMIMSAAVAYLVDTRLMMAIMEQDSRFGTAGVAVRTLNPGNVGNDDDGNIRTYESWQEGVTAVAEWLNRHRISTIVSDIPDDMATSTPPTATSTPSVILPTATSTPVITTSSTTTATSTTTTSSTTTPIIGTSTPTSIISTTTPGAATSTPTTTSTTTSTTTPATSTSTPPTTSTTTSTTTPEADSSTEEEEQPIVISTTTTMTTPTEVTPSTSSMQAGSPQATTTAN